MTFRDRVRSALQELTKDRYPGAVIHSTIVDTMPGVVVTDDAAMRFAAVHACIRVLSEDIASLPIHLYQRKKDGGKERLRSHPLYELVHDRPNPEMTAFVFKECLMVNVLMTGNAYAFIEFNQAGQVIALWPMLSDNVYPYRSDSGTIRYKCGQVDLSSYEVLHIPGMSFDGLLGLSPIAYARESIGLGMAAEQFGSKFFKNGTHLGGVITDPGVMGDTQFERAKEQFGAMYKGLQNSHGIPILEKGATYQPIGIPPEDAQFLETRKFQRTEIAAIYRVPLHLIGDLERATFSNIEHQDLAYLQRTLLPWLVRWEQAMIARLLTVAERKKYVIEFDTANFLRGDTKSRMEAYSIAVNAGIMTPNEARAKENMNPMEGGDDIRLPLNTQAGSAAGNDPASKGARTLPFPFGGEQRAAGEKQNSADANRDQAALAAAAFEPFILWFLTQKRAKVQAVVDMVYGQRSLPEIVALRAQLKAIFMGATTDVPALMMAEVITQARSARAAMYAGLGLDDRLDDWYPGFIASYSSRVVSRLNAGAYAELMTTLKKAEAAGGNVPDIFHKKLATWKDVKARRLSEYEGTRLVMAVKSEVITRCGYELVWDTNPACCDLCQRLNNKTIALGGQFASKADGAGGLKRHPPLHKGCHCSVRAGKLLDSSKIPSNMLNGKKIDPLLRDLSWETAPFSSDASLIGHMNKHMAPYAALDPTFDKEKYKQAARLLLATTPSATVESFVGLDWKVYKYNRATNDFAVGEDGHISSFYKPDEGVIYWERKKRKHGIK